MKVSKILLSSFLLGAFLSSDAGNLSAQMVPGYKGPPVVSSPQKKLSADGVDVNKAQQGIPRTLVPLSQQKLGKGTPIFGKLPKTEYGPQTGIGAGVPWVREKLNKGSFAPK